MLACSFCQCGGAVVMKRTVAAPRSQMASLCLHDSYNHKENSLCIYANALAVDRYTKHKGPTLTPAGIKPAALKLADRLPNQPASVPL